MLWDVVIAHSTGITNVVRLRRVVEMARHGGVFVDTVMVHCEEARGRGICLGGGGDGVVVVRVKGIRKEE